MKRQETRAVDGRTIITLIPETEAEAKRLQDSDNVEQSESNRPDIEDDLIDAGILDPDD